MAGSTGQVQFNNGGALGASANLFWDNTNSYLGIGTSSPATPLNVSVSTAVDAVRITQTGAGNALVVEDSANPDATPFVVNAIGDVGIGTSLPLAKLHINGTSGSPQARIGTSAGYYEVNAFDGNPVYLVVNGSNHTSGVIGTQSNTPFAFFTNNTERMRIDSAGNVGIGTSSPGTKLEVNQGILTINTTDQSLTRLQLKTTGSGGRTYEIVGGLPGTNNSQLSFYDATAAATRMTIDSSGNVGIGTSSPAQKLDVSGNVNISGALIPSSSFLRNRIINGDMRIDQRNAGAVVTINAAAATYTLDRWFGFGQTTDGVFTIQRSTTAPTSFTNSLLVTVTTADASLGSTQNYVLAQYIEGFNCADFGWGAAGAQTVTLSFWVRSSVTGTYGGSLRNGAANRSYPFTYTISAANTWEYKTATVAGDTTGTWATDNTSGPQVVFSLGAGSTLSGTAGAWAGSNLVSATGATNLMATNGATFYITGVQLEVGTAATPFERRQFGQELALCQRYFYITNHVSTGSDVPSGGISRVVLFYPVTMRASPTLTLSGGSAATLDSGAGTTGSRWFRVTSSVEVLAGTTASAEL